MGRFAVSVFFILCFVVSSLSQKLDSGTGQSSPSDLRQDANNKSDRLAELSMCERLLKEASEVSQSGKHREALLLFRKAEALATSSPGHFRVAVEGEATALLAMGQAAQALRRLEEIRPLAECGSCAKSDADLQFHFFAASVALILRRHEDALKDMRAACTIAESLYGETHEESIAATAMLVSVLASMNRGKEGLALHRRISGLAEQTGLRKGSVLGRILFNEVELSGKRLSLEHREKLLIDAVQCFQNDPRMNAAGAAAPLLALADAQIRQHRFAAARETLERLFQLHETSLQHDPRFYYHGLLLKAELLRSEGNWHHAKMVESEAKTLYENSATMAHADWTVSIRSLRQ